MSQAIKSTPAPLTNDDSLGEELGTGWELILGLDPFVKQICKYSLDLIPPLCLLSGGRDMKALFPFTGSQQSGAVTGSFSAPKENHIWSTLVPKYLSPKCSSWKSTRKRRERACGFVYCIYLCVHAVLLFKCPYVSVWTIVWSQRSKFMILWLVTNYIQLGL